MSKKLIEAILTNTNPSSFVGLDTETVVLLKGGKKNPMQGRVTKRVTGSNVMIFKNEKSNAYENMVTRRLIAEGKNPARFTLQPLAWGEREPNTPFIKHKAGLYLQVIFLKSGTIDYFIDGQPIAKDAIVGLPEDREESEQGGLSQDNKVIIRTYSISSIKKLRIDHEEFNNN